MLEGEFTGQIHGKPHPADPSYGQEPGTMSQMVKYLNHQGLMVALVHRTA